MHTKDELIDALDRGRRFKYLFFWGHTAAGEDVTKACLSQWYPSPFVVNGHRYATAEHWMMAEKARLFGDDEHLQAILTARTPGEAKALGRKVRGFEQSVWNDRRFDIVRRGSVHKFLQNQELGDWLLNTKDRVLVEAAPRDTIWGIGLSAQNPRAQDPRTWRGRNLLGFALMAARDELRTDTAPNTQSA